MNSSNSRWKIEVCISKTAKFYWHKYLLKPVQNKKVQKNLQHPTKKQSFSKEKDCFFLSGTSISFGPSYFETALMQVKNSECARFASGLPLNNKIENKSKFQGFWKINIFRFSLSHCSCWWKTDSGRCTICWCDPFRRPLDWNRWTSK